MEACLHKPATLAAQAGDTSSVLARLYDASFFLDICEEAYHLESCCWP